MFRSSSPAPGPAVPHSGCIPSPGPAQHPSPAWALPSPPASPCHTSARLQAPCQPPPQCKPHASPQVCHSPLAHSTPSLPTLAQAWGWHPKPRLSPMFHVKHPSKPGCASPSLGLLPLPLACLGRGGRFPPWALARKPGGGASGWGGGPWCGRNNVGMSNPRMPAHQIPSACAPARPPAPAPLTAPTLCAILPMPRCRSV